MAYEIPELLVPIVPVFDGAPPVTRGMAPPVTRGLEPPPLNVPGVTPPTINLPRPPISNPDPGKPKPQDGENEETQEGVDELPMRPFDASTTITIPIPIIEQEVTVPVPKPEVVITAGTTAMTAAVTATGAAVFAKPLFDQVMKLVKPLAKKIAKKLLQKKEVSFPPSVECKLPDQFLFEGPRLTPLLSRQHRDRRKEKKGAKKPPSE